MQARLLSIRWWAHHFSLGLPMVLISRSITKQFTCTLAGLAALQGCMGSTTCALHAAQINPDKNKPSAVHLTTNQVPYYKLAINEEGQDKYPGDYPLPATAHTDRCPCSCRQATSNGGLPCCDRSNRGTAATAVGDSWRLRSRTPQVDAKRHG